MRLKNLIAYLFLGFVAMSCIQDEALNSEAAIDACTGADVQFVDINADFKKINIYVHKNADLSAQELIFTIPTGASLTVNEHYPNDVLNVFDFSNESHSRTFTVKSEDEQWEAVYSTKIIPAELPSSFHFENLLPATENAPYDIICELEGNSSNVSQALQWASGNPGFKLTQMADNRTGYPTQQVADGYRGKGLKLTTCDTGSFGATVKMYIAAGNLFIGSFSAADAINNPLQATKFGIQYYKVPQTLTGYYKFKAGDVYTDKGVAQPDIKDRFDIYAVLYEADENSFMLDGSNSLESPNIVSLARISKEEAIETDTWTPFSLDFIPQNNKSIDAGKLKNGKYKLSIVLSSSVDGAHFRGAVGSTLYVDELELISQDN